MSNSAFLEAERTQQQKEYHDFTKSLLNYRKNHEVLQTGELLQYVPENNVYVYFRYNEDSRIMVVLNNNPEAQKFALDRFSEGLNGADAALNVLTGEKISLGKELEVPGKCPLILELNQQ